jgi:hypothetical protein
VIEQFVDLLLVGGAHEVLSRSPYRFDSIAEYHAAAAGFLAWHKARLARANFLGTISIGFGGIIAAGYLLKSGAVR